MKSGIGIYLAGPFFTEEQLGYIKSAEDVLSERYNVFSPRKCGVLKIDSSASEQDEIFSGNVEGIQRADVVVLQLAAADYRAEKIGEISFNAWTEKFINDYSYRRGGLTIEELATLRSLINSNPMRYRSEMLPNYSDTGTLVELGMAYMAGKKLVGWSPKPQTRINVMISRACQVFYEGPAESGLIEHIDMALRGETKYYKGGTQ